MKLYSYYRSTAAYRVRIALNLKGLAYERAVVDLRAGAQRDDAFLALNPQGLIPVLTHGDTVLFETAAIALYLVDRHAVLGWVALALDEQEIGFAFRQHTGLVSIVAFGRGLARQQAPGLAAPAAGPRPATACTRHPRTAGHRKATGPDRV